MRKHFKHVINLSLIVAILLGCSIVVNLIGISSSESADYPVTGVYWNKELGLYLNFSDHETTMLHSEGTSEKLDIYPAGRFLNHDGTFNAWYSWDKQDDSIKINLLSYCGDYSMEKTYIFVRSK